MLCKLKLELYGDNLSFRKSSNLQGVLFEHIDSDYATFLHSQSINPYSQSIIRENDKWIWTINTLTDEARKYIIEPLLDEGFSEFSFRKEPNNSIRIMSKKIEELDIKELLKSFYDVEADKYYNIQVMTPAAFKKDGEYCVMPDIRLILQSLMNKCNTILAELDMTDEDTLKYMSTHTTLLSYKLNTTRFPLEGTSVPGFYGSMIFKMKGTSTMAAFIRILLKFGEYSGIGIKTSMGMGAIKLIERE